ncbi:hypothetical protein LshimejAT787_0705900 [Lyophyllum shimeji]|uniref:Uncharacterized protein n=1 Tax=Lyophyllum shimeji TaxID=47721 RepID=A0A9P3PP68_LYOSH|nr:hypothetical protein LshimejAT787_0705900 [Lyophyllum shimeji]
MAKAKEKDARSTKSTTSVSSSLKSLASKFKKVTRKVTRTVTALLSPSKPKKRKRKAPEPEATDGDHSDSSLEQGPPPKQRHVEVIEVADDDDGMDEEAEASDEELERMAKKWDLAVYAFFEPMPKIVYVKGRRAHEFACTARGCKYTARRYLDTRDKTSTSNLIKHVRSCWGEEAWVAANECSTVDEARKSVVSPLNTNGSILASFKLKGKGKVTYSHRQHTRTETRAEIIRWVSETYWIPSASTVSQDVKLVFGRSCERIAKMLQEHEGAINFATDA